ncbi:hypothetical protein FS749_004996 [Ceratobasidium sp. UAMH 11750]|nr:hypothetical protein FS749_004996 [Ceratobasidium sp. UAMH 11750]
MGPTPLRHLFPCKTLNYSSHDDQDQIRQLLWQTYHPRVRPCRTETHAKWAYVTAGDGFVFDVGERTGQVPGPFAPTLPSDRTISHKWIVLAGIVESGALAPMFMLAALIPDIVQDGQESHFSHQSQPS